jgi:hypothetical protein
MAAGTRQLSRPAPPGAVFAIRELRFWLTDYRRTWRGSICQPAEPLLFLGAMGLGRGPGQARGHLDRRGQHLTFLAPGCWPRPR